jgi:glyoxylase-like metal-dependent hydrolase (beta-lactamase superfamily II)
MTSPPTQPANVTAEGETYLSAPRRLQFITAEPPQAGQAVSIAPGVRWCRIPLPIDLNHINVWLIDHEDGCVVVDTGMADPTGEEAWLSLEATVLNRTPLRGVFVTHFHPDHIGLARWLQERYQVPVWTSPRTAEQLLAFNNADPASAAAQAEHFFASNGVTDPSLAPSLSPARFVRMTSGMPDVSETVADGGVLSLGGQSWRALETNGHAEGHLCLYEATLGLLISGDQVLPTISPNVGMTWRSHDPNPLRSFLDSLQRLHRLPKDTLVLPSHGVPFHGLQSRVEDLRAHHEEQLNNIVSACAKPQSAMEILPVMFRRSLRGMHLFLAMAEALAHLEYLVSAQRLDRKDDAGGVIRYVALA